MSNSAGNTNRDLRRFCREVGIKPSAGNVEKMGREVRRTMSQNEQVNRIAKEQGKGLRGKHGDVGPQVKERVAREMRNRERRS